MTIPFLNKIPSIVKVIFCLGLIFVSDVAFSTHIVGGEMTYRHLRDDVFEIALTIRRDCIFGDEDAQFDNPAVIAVYTGDGRLATWVGEFGFLEIPFNQDDTLNTVVTSDCGFIGQEVCVQESRYVKEIRLPYRTAGYHLSYQRCCRNITLNNIVDPTNTGSTYTTFISGDAIKGQNSTPTFNEWADIYICANQQLAFDHSATDTDGDSLVYKLVTPYSGASEMFPKPDTAPTPPYNPVVFFPPYNINDLMGGVPLEFNVETGLLTALPNTVGQFLIGVSVEEYRNGELLSTVRRDFEYNVRICSEAPSISFEAENPVCNDYTTTFNNTSADVDQFVWYFDFPNEDPQFMSTEVNPTFTFPSSGTYLVMLEGTRVSDGCSATFTEEIVVLDNIIEVDFTAELSSCGDNVYSLLLSDNSSDSTDPNNQPAAWNWTVSTDAGDFTGEGNEATIEFEGTTGVIELVVTMANGCTNSKIEEFNIDNLLPVPDFTAYISECMEDGTYTLTLSDNSENQADITNFDWSLDIDGDIQSLSGPSVSINVVGNEIVDINYIVTYNNGCISEIDTSLDVQSVLPSASFSKAVSCNSDGSVNLILESTSNLRGMIVSLDWEVSLNGQTASSYEGDQVVIENLDLGTMIHVTLKATYINDCVATTEDLFDVTDLLPNVAFDAEVTACNNDGTFDLTLKNASDDLEKISSVNWEIIVAGDIIISNDSEVTISGLSIEDILDVSLGITYNNGCDASTRSELFIGDILPIAEIIAVVSSCNEDGTVDVTLSNGYVASGGINSILWTVDLESIILTSDEEVFVLKNVSNDEVLNIELDVSYNNGCDANAIAEIIVADILPKAFFTTEITECKEDGSYEVTITDNSGDVSSIDWNITINGTSENYTGSTVVINVDAEDEVTIIQTVAFENGCENQVESSLDILSLLPDASLSVEIQSCNEDGTVDVILIGDSSAKEKALNYTWNVTINGNENTYNGSQVILENVDPSEILDIQLSIDFTTSCNAMADENITVSDLLPSAKITPQINSCNSDGTVDLTLVNSSDKLNEISSAEWELVINGETQSYTGNVVTIPGIDLESIIEVTLTVSYMNNCDATVSENYDLHDHLPQAIIDAKVTSCDNDNRVNIVLNNVYDSSFGIQAIMWTVDTGEEVLTSNEESFELENIDITSTIAVTLDVIYNNGCSASATEEIIVADILPMAAYDAVVTQCNDDGTYEVTITDNSGEIETVSWIIAINGQEETYTGSPVILTLNLEDALAITQSVDFSNGCSDTEESELSVVNLVPNAEIVSNISSCNNDGTVDLHLSFTSNATDTSSVLWEVNIDGESITSSENEVSIPGLLLDSEVTVNLSVEFVSTCSASDEQSFTLSDLLPQASYSADLISCPDDENIIVQLIETSDETPVSISWNIESNGEAFVGTDTTIIIQVNKNSISSVSLDLVFESGCTSTLTDTLNIENLLPTPEFNFEVLDCPTQDSVNVQLSDATTVDDNIISWDWIISFSDQQVTSSDSSLSFTVPKDSSVSVSLTVGIENGCVLILEDGSFVPELPSVEFLSDTVTGCLGDTVQLVANPDPSLQYTWDPEEGLIFDNPDDKSNPSAIISGEMTYNVTVSDGVCDDNATVNVAIDPNTTIGIEGDSISCDGTIELVAMGGQGGGFFQWSTSEDFSEIIGEGDTLLYNLQNSDITIWLRLTDSNCDAEPVSTTIKNGMPDLAYLDPYEICRGDTLNYSVTNLDPDQVLAFLWEDNSHIISGDSTNAPLIGIGIEEMDSFYLVFSVENQYGCTFTDSIFVQIIDNPEISFDSEIEVCGEYTVCFNITSEFNGTPLWDFGDPESGFMNASVDEAPCHTYPGPGDYIVTLSTLSNYCSSSESQQTITLTEAFTVDSISNQNVCPGDTVILSASASVEGLDFVWCTPEGDTLATGVNFEYIADSNSIDVLLKGFDFFGCSDTSEFTIDVFTFDLQFDLPEVLCNGEETQISVTNTSGGDLQYLWGPEDAIVSGEDTDSPIVSITETTELTLSVFESNAGCVLDTSITVTASNITATIVPDPGNEINEGEEVILDVESDADIVDYEWSDPSLNGNPITVAPTETTTYTVTVTDENGCTAVASTEIMVRQAVCDETDVFIPNAFTPNGDGVNDVFRVRSNFIEEMELIVYNRWGQEIFRSTDQDQGWDGSFNGDELGPDVYGFRLEVLCINDEVYVTKGNVSLLR